MIHTDRITAAHAILALDTDELELSMIYRSLLICDDTYTIDADLESDDMLPFALALQLLIRSYTIDELTSELYAFSLCPMHRIDYAICFDDDDPHCAAIRAVLPSHDT